MFCRSAYLCALGMPIVNDQIYPQLRPATAPDQAPDFSQPLQLLARSLRFTDPVTGQLREFHSQRQLALAQAQSNQTNETDVPTADKAAAPVKKQVEIKW